VTAGGRRQAESVLHAAVSGLAPAAAGILILSWEGRDLLADHLPSVVAAARRSGIPVAVADNGSSDGTLDYLAREFPTVGRIAIPDNLGFGGGYNAAMPHVPWEVVVLLNNDMLVAEDFADHLLEPFAQADDVFAVGAQIFHQDERARRQETGRTSARFHDGELQCAHVPVETEDGFVPVLWAGGGSSAFSRAKFAALGGFEDLYNPFYFEDVDLSFRAWKRGWRVLLAPRSKVYHRHRASSRRLNPSYVDRVVARNRTLFTVMRLDHRQVARHAARALTPHVLRLDGSRPDYRASLDALRLLPDALARRWAADGASERTSAEILARFATDWTLKLPPDPVRTDGSGAASGASDAAGFQAGGAAVPATGRPLTLLVFVPLCVYPVSHGGASRIVNTIHGMSRRGHQVHVLSLVATEEEREGMKALPGAASSHSFALPRERWAMPGGMAPRMIAESYRPQARELLDDAVRRYRPDVVVLEYTMSGAYLEPALGAPTILVEHDVAYRSAARGARVARGRLARARAYFDVARLYRWELETARKADLVLAASGAEAAVLRRRGVPRVSDEVPNGVDVAAFDPGEPREQTGDVLFVGAFSHPPNTDGLEYFTGRIWPHLKSAGRPGVTVVGAGLPGALEGRCRDEGFECAGFVDDLPAALWRHKVFVCPIRYGAGTRIKLLEAAAARCAIVSTALGAEGLGFQDGRELLLADDPAGFAAAVRRLLDDPDLRRRLGDAAHESVRLRFDWPVLAARLERLCYDLAGET
jgi:GT2 family glycosyltransferase/glycosyltransferase involved in cell wall biosynthesis